MSKLPPDPLRVVLERARDELSGRPRPEAALASLLEAWVELRAPALAALVEALSAKLAAQRPPLGAQVPASFHREWLERAAKEDPAELGVLLASMAETRSAQALARLRALAPQLPDPRFVSAAVELIRAPPFVGSTTGKFWTQLYRMLVASADPRAIVALEAIDPPGPARLISSMTERLERARLRNIALIRRALTELHTEPEASLFPLLDELRERVSALELGDAGRGQVLLDAVLQEPREQGHRHVYADFLLARGDPRGEFIALQLAEELEPSARARARARELLGAHGRAWLGELGHALTQHDQVFMRGFLHAARLKVNPTKLERIIEDPLWATVVSVANAPVSLLASPALRSLESLIMEDPLILDLLLSELSLPRVRSLELELRRSWRSVVFSRSGFSARFRTALGRPDVLPGLQRLCIRSKLDVPYAQLEWLWASPLLARLRGVELRLPDADTMIPAAVYAHMRQRPMALDTLEIRHGRARFVFVRAPGSDERRPWARVELRAGKGAGDPRLQAQLQALAGFEELEVRGG